MAEGRKLKTEHAGAKNGGGYWGPRVDAKRASRKRRRMADRDEVRAAECERDRNAVRAMRVLAGEWV